MPETDPGPAAPVPHTPALEPAGPEAAADLAAIVDRLVTARLAALAVAAPASPAVPEWLGPLLENQQRVADTLAVHTKPKQIDNPEQRSPFNPAGDRDHPRPDLQCDIRHCGVSLSRATLTVTEIELLNRLTPGEFWVRKTDGSEDKVTIVPKWGDTGDLVQLNIRMDVKDETGTKKHGWPSLANLCRQILGEPEVHPPARRSPAAGRRAARAGEADLTAHTLQEIGRTRPEIAASLATMLDRPTDRV